MGGNIITPSPCRLLLPTTYLFRPYLDPLPLLPPGSAPGTGSPLLVLLHLLVQVLHQLLDRRVGGRGADFLILLGGKPVGAGRKVCLGVGRGEDTGREGLAGDKLLQMAPTTVGYSHNRTQQASRLWSLEDVGLHQVAGDGALAVLQAAVRG